MNRIPTIRNRGLAVFAGVIRFAPPEWPARAIWRLPAVLVAAFGLTVLIGVVPGRAADFVVQAMNFRFQVPSGGSTLTISVGDQVTWIASGNPHTVSSGTPGAIDNRFPDHPASVGLLDSGSSFSAIFTNPGTYPYFCEVHPEQMTGVVVVLAASTLAPTSAPSPTPTPRPTVSPKPRPVPTPSPGATPSATVPAQTSSAATATLTPPTPDSAALGSPTPTSSPERAYPAPSQAVPGPSATPSALASPSSTPSASTGGEQSSGPIPIAVAATAGLAVLGGLLLALRGRGRNG